MLLQAACTFPSTRSRVDRSQNSILKIQVICLRQMSARLKRLCRSAPPASPSMRGFTAPVTVLNEGQKIAFDVVVDRKNPAKSSADNLQAV
jgi:hypothetical protein